MGNKVIIIIIIIICSSKPQVPPTIELDKTFFISMLKSKISTQHQWSVGQLTTDMLTKTLLTLGRPHIDRVSVRYRQTVGKVLRYRPSVDETKTVSVGTHLRRYIARCFTDSRLMLDRYLTDTRPSRSRYVGQVAVDTRLMYRPSVGRYIDR